MNPLFYTNDRKYYKAKHFLVVVVVDIVVVLRQCGSVFKWMRCYRKILRISYKDLVTNEEVRAKIQQAIGLHEELLTIVKRSKVQWYGHVSRSSVWPKPSCKAQ